MSYATTADLEAIWSRDRIDMLAMDRLSQLRDVNRVSAALDSASAQMDGYLARRYRLPITATPGGKLTLKKLCADIAVYDLATSGEQMIDIIQARYRQAVDLLRDVAAARAEIDLVPQSGADPGPAIITSNEPVLVGRDRLFSRDSLRGM